MMPHLTKKLNLMLERQTDGKRTDAQTVKHERKNKNETKFNS